MVKSSAGSRPRLSQTKTAVAAIDFFPEKISKAAIRRVTFPPVHHMPFVSAVHGEVLPFFGSALAGGAIRAVFDIAAVLTKE